MSKTVGAIVTVAAIAVGAFYYTNSQAEKAIKAQIEIANNQLKTPEISLMFPGLQIAYQDVSANVLFKTYTLHGLSLRAEAIGELITADTITLKNIHPQKLNNKASSSIHGLKLSEGLLQKITQNVQFIKGLSFSFEQDYEYFKDGQLSWNFTTKINDEFTLSTSMSLANMQTFWQLAQTAAELSEEEKIALQNNANFEEEIHHSLRKAALNSATITLNNSGFIERSFEELGAPNGLTYEVFKTMSLITLSAQANIPDAIKAPLTEFLTTPKNFTTSVSFNEPLSFAKLERGEYEDTINSPEALIKFSNFKLTAN